MSHAVSAVAFGPGSLLAGRFLVGLSLGATSCAVPIYSSEVAPPRRRGALVTLNQLMITIELLLSYVTAYALEPIDTCRWMLAIGIAPAVILLIGTLLVPESPEWLRSRVHGARAERAAHRLGIDVGLPSVETSSVRGLSLRQACPEAGPRWVALGLTVAVLVHLTGSNTAIY